MKKLLLIGSIVLVLGLLIAGLTAPIFAHGPDDGGAIPADEGAWEAMHETCENGDYEAMAEWHAQYHGEEDTMGSGMMDGWEGSQYGWGGMGGSMRGSMMGW